MNGTSGCGAPRPTAMTLTRLLARRPHRRPGRRPHHDGPPGRLLVRRQRRRAAPGRWRPSPRGSAETVDRRVEPAGGDGAGGQESGTDSDARSTPCRPLDAPAIERHVISTGTVSLISDDVAKARRDVQRIVDAQQGTITEENTETDDKGVATYSRMVVRVPSSSFATTVLALEKVAELRSSQTTQRGRHHRR